MVRSDSMVQSAIVDVGPETSQSRRDRVARTRQTAGEVATSSVTPRSQALDLVLVFKSSFMLLFVAYPGNPPGVLLAIAIAPTDGW